MDSIVGTIRTISNTSPTVAHIHRAELQKKKEDRTVVLHFKRGTIIAIFDGHCGRDLAKYAAKTLPPLLAKRLRHGVDVEAVLKETIEEFDRSLLSPVLNLFEEDEDWEHPDWSDEVNVVFPIIGYDYTYKSFRLGRRAAVGCTALIAFLDKPLANLWVASLGDSDAVCSRRDDDGAPIFLSERHNCSNPAELERMRNEHPNEDHAVKDGDAVLEALRITRALGDHQLKVPLLMASRIMSCFYPCLIGPENFETFNSYTPPYLSSIPAIRHHTVASGDLFLFASDGLRDELPRAIPDMEQSSLLVGLAKGRPDARLGHECITPDDADNVASRVIANVVFGMDEEKKAERLAYTADRDDISLVVLRIE
ncbi:phosphatase 2C-like domain-containing protein [Mycena crocata]|nr:phosphatase 2C-like domain-containing protein [Mycena crocata]